MPFDPHAQFDHANEAVDLILTQPDPIEALIKVVASNIRAGELGSAKAVIREFQEQT